MSQNNENMHKIEFIVPLSGSQIFDTYSYVTAQNLCADFPGLSFTMDAKQISITGELNDYWYDLWNRRLFRGQ